MLSWLAKSEWAFLMPAGHFIGLNPTHRRILRFSKNQSRIARDFPGKIKSDRSAFWQHRLHAGRKIQPFDPGPG
jgi:hypothetical protein